MRHAQRTPNDAGPSQLLPSRDEIRRIATACHSHLGRPLHAEDLEDVIQDVHVHAWRRLASFRGESSIESWVFGIARLSILRQLSKRERIAGHEQAMGPEDPDPVDPGIRPGSRFDTEFRQVLEEGIRSGGNNALEIFQAHEVEGRPFRAIGERLGLSETAVKSRYYRSLSGLRSRLAPLWAGLQK